MLLQDYHDGTLERSLVTDTVNAPQSLRTWKLSKRLRNYTIIGESAPPIILLSNFYKQQNGGLISFYFYNPMEPAPGQPIGSNFDATGSSIQGRYTVFFRGPWSERIDMARTNTSLQLVEVA